MITDPTQIERVMQDVQELSDQFYAVSKSHYIVQVTRYDHDDWAYYLVDVNELPHYEQFFDEYKTQDAADAPLIYRGMTHSKAEAWSFVEQYFYSDYQESDI